MLDEFVYGEVSRISPEAARACDCGPAQRDQYRRAGNVARNIAALARACIFVGLIGEDEAGSRLKEALSQQCLIETVLGLRFRAADHAKRCASCPSISTHMLRADWELASPASVGIEQKLIDAILPLLPARDIVLLSDYAKGY